MLNLYKYSQYKYISAHLYKLNGQLYHQVFSTRTGTVTYILKYYFDKYLAQSIIPEMDSELFSVLKTTELIVPKDELELEAILNRNHQATLSKQHKSFVILPSSFCNMGCSYCGQKHQKGNLKPNQTQLIIHRIKDAIADEQTKHLSISWFGGEPMVALSQILEISDAINQIIAKKQIVYNANIITNGSLLNIEKLMQLHLIANITNITITIDGPPHIHDSRRPLKNGKPNFLKLIKLLQQAIHEPALQGLSFSLRTNIDKHNCNYIDDYLNLMSEYQLNHPNISYELQFVYPWSNDVSAVELERIQYAQLEVQWMISMFKLGMQFSLLPGHKKVVCVAVNPNAEVISSTGNIFSCTEHPLIEQHEKNDALANLESNQALKPSPFHDFNLESIKKLPCASCKFLGVCAGACPKHWKEGHPPCPSFKFNLQERLDIAAVKKGYFIINNVE